MEGFLSCTQTHTHFVLFSENQILAFDSSKASAYAKMLRHKSKGDTFFVCVCVSECPVSFTELFMFCFFSFTTNALGNKVAHQLKQHI